MKLLNIAGFDVLDSEKRLTWDDADSWVEGVNSDVVAGFTDWVLPDVDTLRALYRICRGDVDGVYALDDWFWSSSPSADGSLSSWYVNFSSGAVYFCHEINCLQVLLVRAGQMFAIGRAGQLESMRLAGILLPGVNE